MPVVPSKTQYYISPANSNQYQGQDPKQLQVRLTIASFPGFTQEPGNEASLTINIV